MGGISLDIVAISVVTSRVDAQLDAQRFKGATEVSGDVPGRRSVRDASDVLRVLHFHTQACDKVLAHPRFQAVSGTDKKDEVPLHASLQHESARDYLSRRVVPGMSISERHTADRALTA